MSLRTSSGIIRVNVALYISRRQAGTITIPAVNLIVTITVAVISILILILTLFPYSKGLFSWRIRMSTGILSPSFLEVKQYSLQAIDY